MGILQEQCISTCPALPMSLLAFPASEVMCWCSAAFDSSCTGFVPLAASGSPGVLRDRREVHTLLEVIDAFLGLGCGSDFHGSVLSVHPCALITAGTKHNHPEMPSQAQLTWRPSEITFACTCEVMVFIWFKLLMAATLLLVFALRWVGFLC